MHIGNNVRKGGPGKEFEAALCIPDRSCGRRGEESKEEVKRVHEKVAEKRPLKIFSQHKDKSPLNGRRKF